MSDCLLLTATVSPRPSSRQLAVRDPHQRAHQYRHALHFYSQLPHFRPIVFCDNSGLDLRPWGLHNDAFPSVRFLNCPPDPDDAPPDRGFGELSILRHATLTLSTDPGISRFWKATGRYIIRNIAPIALAHQSDRAHLLVNCRLLPRPWVDMWVMGWSPAGFDRFLEPLRQQLTGRESAEAVFARILRPQDRSARSPDVVYRLRREPHKEGIRGWDGRSYNDAGQKLRFAARAAAKRLAPWLWI